MLDKTLAQFISANLNVRRQVLTGGNVEVLTNLNKAIDLMDAIGRGDTIASLWSIDDVHSLRTNDDGDPDGSIDDDTARRVLALAESEHDASIGINWDTLGHWLDSVEGGE